VLNITSGYGNSNVATFLTTYTGNLNAGHITGNSMTINGNVIINGNANVQGNLTYNNITNLTTSNLVLGLGNNQTGTNVTGGGIVVGNTAEAALLYNFSTQSWVSNIAITSNANVNGTNFNATGNVVATGNVSAGNISAAGTISDSLGPVRTMLSGRLTVGYGQYPVTTGNTVDVGVPFTLPAAGTYLVTYTMRVLHYGAADYGIMLLSDMSNNVLQYSEILTGLVGGSPNFQSTVTSTYLITVTGSTSYKLRLKSGNGALEAFSDQNGVSQVTWVQVSV
jgi:hypothetical protein